MSRKSMVAFSVAGAWLVAGAAQAQVGTGPWTSYSPSFSVQERGCGDVSDLTFRLTCSSTDGDQRAERRYPTYTSGTRQFQGYFRVVSIGGTRISVKQTFNDGVGAYFILGVEKSGRIYNVKGGGDQQTLSTAATVGNTVRVNTIHRPGGTLQCYINGSLKLQFSSPSGGFYDKIGTYRTSSGYGPITVEWSGVQFWTAGGTGTPPPTPTPTPTARPTSVPTPTPTSTPNDVEVTPPGSSVTASTHDGNLPSNSVDNNLGTRWSADGDGQWIKLQLAQTVVVSRVRVAAYNGTARQNRFDIQVSTDDVIWTDVLTGAHTSGTTTAEESFDVADAPARWVRYLGHGSSDPTKPTMNSVTEISLFAATATSTPTPTPTLPPVVTPTATPTGIPTYVEVTPPGSSVTASTSDGNLPANTVDNSLSTRWSANGDGQWLQLDLGAERTVGHVGVAVYNGNSRRNRFDIQVATVAGAWTTVWTGESSGTTTAEQTYDFADVPARWVRYLGHMSNASTFNSVTEVSVFAVP